MEDGVDKRWLCEPSTVLCAFKAMFLFLNNNLNIGTMPPISQMRTLILRKVK